MPNTNLHQQPCRLPITITISLTLFLPITIPRQRRQHQSPSRPSSPVERPVQHYVV
ncbi:hypothetical protein PGTUg99_002466 [Puccinia graminis f. sp. tritici]|uniref:Uncharacterized protein n=1 Tax=Puccinia graminis f. sp. tritici TaxID=56615 RepID=A0A5B0PD17_PUCGR|nr:hypothetical protein PGTUg99_002466 [Puccinia graminis f. sp. tritici]